MDAIAPAKRVWRSEMRRRLASLDRAERDRKSGLIVALIRERLRRERPQCVAIFAPMASEPDLMGLLEEPVVWAFPRIHGDQLSLRAVTHPEQLGTGPFGIREPDPAICEEVPPSRIDWVLAPGLGFGRDGSRLGRGKGFYDRLIPETGGAAFGVCFREQLEENLPTDPWDCPMAGVFCDDGWWPCGRGGPDWAGVNRLP